jgi:tripartite-type tricarboxylate transporter receptor subunit TctC
MNHESKPVTEIIGRRRFLEKFGAAATLSALGGGVALAQLDAAANYPAKPIHLMCPFAAGGGVDITARAIAQKLTERWGQPVVVENRSGANGTIAVDLVAKARPDGYMLTMISSSQSVNVTLQRHQPYDLTRDLAPITQATVQPYVLVVHPSLRARSVQELVAMAKANPNAVNYGSSGIGGFSHLAGALFASLAGIDLTHVPYKGGAPAMADVISGQIQMLFSTILQSHGHIASGRLRALAVTTARRSASSLNTPTMQEAGVPGYEVSGWYGVMAPAATPPAIVEKLNQAIVRILRAPETHDRLAVDGSEPVGNTSAQFGEHIRNEIAKWGSLIRKLGIRAE